MKILISNDDGIDSPGIQCLAASAASLGDVTVVAPHRERSTAGHSLTLHKPLRIHRRESGLGKQYSTSGTPADCIYLGTREIMKELPDVILAGINNGANLGTDVHYSGTVAAAREGALMNVRSYAFSLVHFPGAKGEPEAMRFDMAGEIARDVIEKTLGLEFPKHTLINVNIPNIERSRIRGVKIARQGFRYYSNEVLRRTDPRGKEYYWIGGSYQGFEASDVSDCHAVNEGWVSITPITIDCTHNEFYTTLREKLGKD